MTSRDWLYVSTFKFADEMSADDPAFLAAIRATGVKRVSNRAAKVVTESVALGYAKTVGDLREDGGIMMRAPNFGRKCEDILVFVLSQKARVAEIFRA